MGFAAPHTEEAYYQQYLYARNFVCFSYLMMYKSSTMTTADVYAKNSTSAISITRLIAVYTLSQADITWTFAPVMLYSTLEIDSALICACLPVMGPLLQLLNGERVKSSSTDPGRRSETQLKRLRGGRNNTDSFSRLRDNDQKSVHGKKCHEVNIEGGLLEYESVRDNDIHVLRRVEVDGGR